MSNCTNKFGCAGISFKDGFYIAEIKINNKINLIGKYALREDAIVARMNANNKHGLKDTKRLYNSLVMLRDIFASEPKAIKYNHKIESNSNYHWLVEQDKIENACRVDPTKEYSRISSIIDRLGY